MSGNEAIAQWVRLPTVLPEDQNIVPSWTDSQLPVSPAPGISNGSGVHRHLHSHAHTNTDT